MDGRFWTRVKGIWKLSPKDALAQTHHLAAFGLLRQPAHIKGMLSL